MVERGGDALDQGKSVSQNPCILRLNVPDVLTTAHILRDKGADVSYTEHHWGTVAKFMDPDGNFCELKDSLTFEKQVAEGLSRQ